MKRCARMFLTVAFVGLFASAAVGQASPVYLPYYDAVATGSHSIIAGTGTAGTCTAATVTTPTSPQFGSCAGTGGPELGLATTRALYTPQAVAVDGSGNVYVADRNGWLKRITPDGQLQIFAGGTSKASTTGNSTCPGSLVDTSGDGRPANQAYVNGLLGVAIAPVTVLHDAAADCTTITSAGNCIDIYAGDVLIADSSASAVRIIRASDYTIWTLVKGNTYQNGPIGTVTTTAGTRSPNGIAFDKFGHLYIAEDNSGSPANRIRLVDFKTQTISTVVGDAAGTAGCSTGRWRRVSRDSSRGRKTLRLTRRGTCTSPTSTATWCAR